MCCLKLNSSVPTDSVETEHVSNGIGYSNFCEQGNGLFYFNKKTEKNVNTRGRKDANLKMNEYLLL